MVKFFTTHNVIINLMNNSDKNKQFHQA